MRSIPRLTWLNFKQYRQSFGDRKNRPGRKPEHTAALVQFEPTDTENIFFQPSTQKWFFSDETADLIGPFDSKEQAVQQLAVYVEYLNAPQEEPNANPVESN